MKITSSEVKRISDLAKLDLSEAEIELFTEQLDQILNYVSKLNEIDTSQIEPTSHILKLKTPFRNDETKLTLSSADSLRNAPQQEKGHFKVPRIID